MTTDTILNAAPPVAVVVPAAYVLHYYTTICKGCGTKSNGSDFYAMTLLRSRHDTGTAKHFVRCDAPMFNVPVERVHTGTKIMAYCVECPTLDLSHLPPPPRADRVYDLAEPTLRVAPRPTTATASRTAPTSASRKPTLGDLA